jgi:hypothetical protein
MAIKEKRLYEYFSQSQETMVNFLLIFKTPPHAVCVKPRYKGDSFVTIL